MKKTVTRGLFYLGLGFFLLFMLRFIYGYITYPTGTSTTIIQPQPLNWDTILSRKNYASKKLTHETSEKGNVATVDQKYEKIGTLTANTSHFEQDEQQLQTLIQEHTILIQFEQRSGLIGRRLLYMAMGVIPEKFDLIMSAIQNIGTVISIQINKSDKTNEYKELEVKKRALEKTREALSGLKGQGGSIKELIELENRILEIEHEIQTFGVKLGEFDEENEFCTIKLTLLEVPVAPKISLVQRIKVAFEWTVRYYFILMITLCIGVMGIFIVLAIVQKITWIQQRMKTGLMEKNNVPNKE